MSYELTNASRTAVNPFYAVRAGSPATSNRLVQYAALPAAPITASPVPGLTSLYHHHDRGRWGDRRYPGNCGGQLIHDLLLYFQPDAVFDPMTGSGTCRDVCRDLDFPCSSADRRTYAGASKDVCASSPHVPAWRQRRQASR
jgi:hypothetical protein